MLRFTPVFNGSFADGVECLKPLLALQPIITDLYTMTISEWERFIGSGTQIGGRSAYIRSLELPAASFTPAAARVFMRHFARCPSENTFLVWTHAGGAISRVDPAATAFAHRQACFVPEIKSIWDTAKFADTRAHVEWAYDFVEEFGAVAGASGAYLNYIDPLLRNWPEKYYWENYARLKMVKEHWDPDNFFHFQQSIGSRFNPSGTKPLDLSPL